MRSSKRPGLKSVRMRLSKRISDALDVPAECFSPISIVEVKGNREAVVSGCESVLEYEADTVLLRVREGCVRVIGGCLQMQTMIADRVTLRGEICAVYFENAEMKP